VKLNFYVIFLWVAALSGYSQKVNLQKYSVKDGLTQSTVKCIEQDNYGNLWLATSNGLSGFNGKTFTTITTTNGLPSNEINNLLFANDLLFIGTKKGFCSYDGHNIDLNPLYKHICGNVKKILQKKNVIHVITTKGYYLLDVANKVYELDSVAIQNIASQNPTDAEFDEDGNLWIATSRKGLFFIETTISTKVPRFVLVQNAASSTTINNKLVRIANFNSSNLFKGDAIFAIKFDRQNNLLVSDWGFGIARLKFDLINNSGFSANYLNFDSISPDNSGFNRIVNIHKDAEGNIYLASDGAGFMKIPVDKNINENDYTIKDLSLISVTEGFYGSNPLCFKQDNYQNLWIGTLYDGLVVMNNKSSRSYNKQSGLAEERIISVFRSALDSSIWLGSYGGGAFRYKDKKFTHCFWEQGIGESIIKTIVEDNNGNIILGTTGGGISIITKENTQKQLLVSKKISQEQGLISKYISYLYKAKSGAIWIGYHSENRVDRLILNKDLSFTITSFNVTGLSTFNVSCILEDQEANIWITSNEGTWKLNPKTEYVNSEYAIFKNIQTIAEDWNGNMWLGTSDVGAIILKNKLKARYFEKGIANNFEKLTTENGISSNCVNTILFAKDAAWFVSNNGLNEMKFDTYLNRVKEIKTFNKGQGFASYDNKPNTAVFDHKSSIWIGSIEGLTEYKNNAEEMQDINLQRKLPVFINNVLLQNKNIDWTKDTLFTSGEYSSLKFDGFFNWYKIPKDLELDNAHSTITFMLNTDAIAEQKQVNYRYKLIGYDKDWAIVYNTNEITYRNLPSGDYNLVVMASLSNEFTDAEEYAYHFTITPPFWKTKLFYFVIGLGLLAFFYFFIVSRERRLKREKLKLELIVKARTAEIEKKRIEIELQKNLIQGINNDLTDSIKYAERIQQTILPKTGVLSDYFASYFIYYKPRNIVSGDYYWMKEIEGLMYVAVVDCTGHGVPGAFMSLISSNILNEAANTAERSPSKMLEFLRKELNVRLSQNATGQINDGLDISLICYDKEKQSIEYVNANRPLYIISNDELITLNSENVNIGGYADFNSVIPTKTITVKSGDQLFLFTDGITDQFGGEKNKKYNPARLRQFLLMNNHLVFADLKNKLSDEISDWQQHYEQTDDILLIGLKI
jgi:ligand-binding sensor domain-containing protein/serine phosphatase RsbU (regulator of sigma subunit)